MMNKRLYVDIHVLQTVPPSCVNRDDTGSPKTAVYGGTTRARVSSQAWKRAVRRMFMERMAEADVGIRTKYVYDLLVEEIRTLAPDANAENQTEEGFQCLRNPKFELYQDKAGQFRFRLKARNGKIIGISEGYTGKAGCLNGIESVMTNAADAETEG